MTVRVFLILPPVRMGFINHDISVFISEMCIRDRDTLARICETLNCEITDVIELVPDESASTGGKKHERLCRLSQGL